MAGEMVRVIGLAELEQKLSAMQWVKGPAGRFLDRWRFATQRATVANMKRGVGGWIDSGKTRQSATSERDTSAFPVYARVGSNASTFRWGEFGTGLLSEDPESRKRRYRPPAAALENWASRHGMTGGQVASIIYNQGGLKPRRYLRTAFAATEGQVPGFLSAFASDIEKSAGTGV